MEQALLVSNAVLWLLVIGLAGVVLALMRQIGVLQERVAPAGALVGAAGPRVGEPAPRLEVEDWHGERLEVGASTPGGARTLLFFLSPSCPVCKTLLPALRSLRDREHGTLRAVFVGDGGRAEHQGFVGAHGLDREIYIVSARIGQAYRVGALPYAVLLDGTGVVRAKGLVSTREHLESLLEAEAHGVASLQEYVARERA